LRVGVGAVGPCVMGVGGVLILLFLATASSAPTATEVVSGASAAADAASSNVSSAIADARASLNTSALADLAERLPELAERLNAENLGDAWDAFYSGWMGVEWHWWVVGILLLIMVGRCCSSPVNAKLVELLDSSTHSFICGDWCAQPVLALFGLGIAALQAILLLLVWTRAEANLFYEFYSMGLLNTSVLDPNSYEAQIAYHFPTKAQLETLGTTDVNMSSFQRRYGQHATSSDIELYATMLQWSASHPYIPRIFTHPDLQLDYALIFSLIMIFVWASKDLVTSVTAFCTGHYLVATTMGLNVLFAFMTGWDQMYARFLPVFQEDNPSNVIGISPVTMILNSVAVMLIFDLDDKAFTMIKGVARGPVLKLQKYLREHDDPPDQVPMARFLDEEDNMPDHM